MYYRRDKWNLQVKLMVMAEVRGIRVFLVHQRVALTVGGGGERREGKGDLRQNK